MKPLFLILSACLLLLACEKSTQNRDDFLSCKINGAEFNANSTGLDTLTFDSLILFVQGIRSSDSSELSLHFHVPAGAATYQPASFSGLYSRQINNRYYAYYNEGGQLNITKNSDRCEGTFKFIAVELHDKDTLHITDGSFSVRKP